MAAGSDNILVDPPGADTVALISAAVGGTLVLGTYYAVFRGEAQVYRESRYWLGLDPSSVDWLVPLQATAGIGFLVFLAYASGAVDGRRPNRGLLSYADGHGLAIAVAVFSLASVAWPLATRFYLDDGPPTVTRALLPASSLVAAAASAIAMTAGAFEANLPGPALVAVLLFSTVVVMADAVGWNARLLLGAAAGEVG